MKIHDDVSKTIHLDTDTFRAISELAEQENRTVQETLTVVIEHYQKARFWEQARKDIARLRADPAAWAEYQDEIALWDTLAGDGLESEGPWVD